ncbi:MAG: integrase [Salinisphaeraceae bacterium]|nr:integrase [Salinisphaeraceae bacterium]
MARTTKPLTNTEISHAKPKEKVFSLSDGGGLQLRIKPNGSKIWHLDYYRPYTKKRTSLSLGAYPSVSLAEARSKRDDAKKLLSQNIDPQEHRDEHANLVEAAQSNTLLRVAEQWLEIKKTKVTQDHALDAWRSLELHVFPTLGKVPISKITAVKAIDTIRPVAAKGSLETVKRLCQRLNEIMTYAVNAGLLEANPLTGISKAFQSPTKRHQPTLPPTGLPDLMAALANANIKRTTRCLIEWQLHTMVRPGEAAGTRWDEIEIDTGVWNIPADRMKKKKPHSVPLSPQALALLEAMRPISRTSEYVFPSDRSLKKHIHPHSANVALKRMGFHKKLVAHGLRSLASTTLNEQGFDPDIIEAALAHTGRNEVRNAYNRAEYMQRRSSMMDWWSAHIENASTGNLSITGTQHLSVVAG